MYIHTHTHIYTHMSVFFANYKKTNSAIQLVDFFLRIHLQHTHSQFWSIWEPPDSSWAPEQVRFGPQQLRAVLVNALPAWNHSHSGMLEPSRACRQVVMFSWTKSILWILIQPAHPAWAACKCMFQASCFIYLSCSFLICKMKELFWMFFKNTLNSTSLWVYDF